MPMPEMLYVVRCRVSGGVTGTREGTLKGKDGKIVVFETREEAAAEAQLQLDSLSPHVKAKFEYWPEPAKIIFT